MRPQLPRQLFGDQRGSQPAWCCLTVKAHCGLTGGDWRGGDLPWGGVVVEGKQPTASVIYV